jgi:hypothetical protein
VDKSTSPDASADRNHPDREHIWPGLTAAQADGLACVVCASDYLTDHTPHRPVGRSHTGSQVFACAGACADQAGGWVE